MELKHIFCVIDPTTVHQHALARCQNVAKAAGASVHAHICLDSTAIPTSGEDRDLCIEAEVDRHQLWLNKLVEPLREAGITVTTEVECCKDWRSHLPEAVKRSGADLVVKASFRRNPLKRLLLKTADWTLLGESPCPVLFVKAEPGTKLTRVAAAVNLQADDEPHIQLTDEIIERSKTIAEAFGAELHAVNAYSGSLDYVYPADLAQRVGIDSRNAHVGDMSPEALLADVVTRHEIPLVVLGSLARRGIGSAVVGKTSARILDSLPSDVLVIMRNGKNG